MHRYLLPLFFLGVVDSIQSQQVNPSPARIDSVVPLALQPQEENPATIWFDDFDDDSKQALYAEQTGGTVSDQRFGASGKSLRMHYPAGHRGIGNRKVFFGDTPTHTAQAVRRGQSFSEIYWRIYVKHPFDWQGGGPAKLSRATSIVPPGWRQSMIAHVWSSGNALTLDPASGVRGAEVVTRRYNDFENLRWLGNRPASKFQLHGSDGMGWWVCIEARAKLNTPGQKDGINQLWIDGRLEAERRGLDWRGNYVGHGINAVFLEAYWNEGSPVEQSRWIDNFVVSTKPIGPITAPRNPVLLPAIVSNNGDRTQWQVEVARALSSNPSLVWQSRVLDAPTRIVVDSNQGQFVKALAGRTALEANATYIVRVRCRDDGGEWEDWSPWHQQFVSGE